MPQLTYRAGSKDDFDRLYQANYPRIYATLVVLLRDPAAAEDCAQEAFLRAFRAWGRWNQAAPAEAWLYRIALNTASSWRRRERLREAGELIRRLGRPHFQAGEPGSEAMDLLKELRALPTKQAAVLVLRHLHGYSNREIAAAMGVPEATVASRLATGRATLRGRLEDKRSQRTTVTSDQVRVSSGS
ncbi:MAG: sigma-70 family RNA polymerase sigma factor [Candidatus Dormiibacterota bacterium]